MGFIGVSLGNLSVLGPPITILSILPPFKRLEKSTGWHKTWVSRFRDSRNLFTQVVCQQWGTRSANYKLVWRKSCRQTVQRQTAWLSTRATSGYLANARRPFHITNLIASIIAGILSLSQWKITDFSYWKDIYLRLLPWIMSSTAREFEPRRLVSPTYLSYFHILSPDVNAK